MSDHPLAFAPPPEVFELAKDPRTDGLAYDRGMPRTILNTLHLEPAQVPRHASTHLLLRGGASRKGWIRAEWHNPPECDWALGNGCGFEQITERPRIEQYHKAPAELLHLWEAAGYFVASPDVIALLSRHDPAALEVCEIDWVFSDGQRLDGYAFVDVVKRIHAYDYRRSRICVQKMENASENMPDGKYIRVEGPPAVLRQDLPPNSLLFRDAWHRDLFVARELAEELSALGIEDQVRFEDPHTGSRVSFSTLKRAASSRSIRPINPVENAAYDASATAATLRHRFGRQLLPLLDGGKFVAAERLLTQWLRALPPTPFHVIANLAATNTPQSVARYFDAFLETIPADLEVAVLYAEMNEFTLNPDLWFCTVYAIAYDGGREDYAWTGDYHSETNEPLVISGLEPLQHVYEHEQELDDADLEGSEEAKELAELLVITKVQRLLQQALPHMRRVKVPVLAGVLEMIESIFEIRPLASSATRTRKR